MTTTSLRWPVPALGKDETLQSLLERAARFFECTPSRLWSATHNDDPSAGDPDNPSSSALVRLALAVDVPGRALMDARIPPSAAWLHPNGRHAYCPHCWEASLKAGAPLTFRRSWARTLSVVCSDHNVPLLLWRPHHEKGENKHWEEEVSVALMALDSLSADPLFVEGSTAIDKFATELDAVLFHGRPAPAAWTGTPLQIQRLMERVLTDAELREAPWSLVIPHRWRGVFHLGRHPVIGPTKSDRVTLTHAQDPGVRRAALWLAASMFDERLPAFMRPLAADFR